MRVTVNLLGFLDKMRDIVHRIDLGLAIYRLALDELSQFDPSQFRVTELANETQYRSKIVNPDIVFNVNPVIAQEFLEEWDPDRLVLDHVDDMLVEITRTDTVIAGVMEPVTAAQLG